MTPAPAALLLDFGGVLTTSPFDSFAAFCRQEGLPADAVRSAFREGEGSALLAGCETGVIADEAFERGFAALLSAGRPAPVDAGGLLGRLQAGLKLEPLVVDAVLGLRSAGVTTVLVSNSLGYDCYGLCDLDALFVHTVLSGRIGVRKPSRRIYLHAADVAGVAPERCLMVDDLPHNLVGAERVGMRTLLHRDAAQTVQALDEAFATRLGATK